MGNRLFVALHRRARLYDIYCSHWGGADGLVDTILQRQPGESSFEFQSVESIEQCGHGRWPELADDLNYLECSLCVRIGPATDTVYLPVWLGIPTGDSETTPSTCGVLVGIESTADLRRLKKQIRLRKDQLGIAIEAGRVSQSAAERWLLTTMAGREQYLSVTALD